MKKFIIIDGNSLINRAFYALPLLTNSEGEFSNAVYGFCNMLVKAIEEYKPEYIAVAFDRKEPTFRHKMYAEYKGTRKGMPDELASQMPILKKILTAMNVCILEQAGIEADDIIGIISKRFEEETIILTGDRDNLQLIDHNTSVWLTKKGLSDLQKVDEKMLLEEFKLKPYQVIELKALMGDASDNIPGVPGIGEKTAMKLLEDYDNLDNLYAHIDEITGKLKEKLVENKEVAYLSKELATIAVNAPFEFNLEDCKYEFPFQKDVYDLFMHYEFKSLLKRKELFDLGNITVGVETSRKIVEKQIKTLDELEKLVSELNKTNELSFFIKNNKLNLAMSQFEEYEIRIKENLLDEGFELSELLDKLKPILENEKIKKVLYDYKSTRHFLTSLGIFLKGVTFDIVLAEYLISGSKKQIEDLNYFTGKYGYTENSLASAMLKAKRELEKQLKQEEMYDLYFNIEFKLIDVLYDMERSGFKIDVKVLDELSSQFVLEQEELTKRIYELAGEEFNINSPKQLGEILFDKLNLKAFNNKKKSTSVDVLEKLVGIHPIIELIMRYRQVAKLNSTYLEGFKKEVDKKTNLVHTVFNQTTASTGRLSSTEPNLQNIPIRTEDGRNLRKMFVSRFLDGVLVTADYSQIELRLMAHYSQDKNLIEAYKMGKDIHAKTASDIFMVKESEVTKEQRRDAKAVNFGIIYGISDYGLSQNIGSTRLKAKDYIDKYFATYPGVKEFMNASIESAKQKGYVSTLMGRRRKIENINATNFMLRQAAERAAMNMPLQGSASDIIKLAMIRVYEKLKALNLKSQLILQVHDELIIDAVESERELVETILKEEMESVINLRVPLIAEVSTGKSWFDTK